MGKPAKSVSQRFFGFATLSAVSALVPLAVLPVAVRIGDENAWVGLAIGQAIGMLVAVVAMLGWLVEGPPAVIALKESDEQLALYGESFWTRLAIFMPACGVGCFAAYAMAPATSSFIAAWAVAATGFGGLSLSWYAVGLGNPTLLARYEVLPKLVGAAASVFALIMTRDVNVYPIVQLSFSVIGLSIFHHSRLRRLLPQWPGWETIGVRVKGHRPAFALSLIGSGYSTSQVPIASTFGSVNETAAFASADRTLRYSSLIASAMANAFQAWVLLDWEDMTGMRRRQRAAIGAHAFVGAGGGVTLALLGPPVSQLLFGASVRASDEVALWYGVAFAASCTATPLIRNILVPLGRTALVLTCTSAGVGIGLVLLLWLPSSAGLAGVSAAMAACDIAVLGLLSAAVLIDRHLRVLVAPTSVPADLGHQLYPRL